MNKILLCILFLSISSFTLNSADDEDENEKLYQSPIKIKTMLNKDLVQPHVKSERRFFVNYLDSPITVFFYDKNDKQLKHVISSGGTIPIDCIFSRIKKVTYFDKQQQKIVSISLAKLQENVVTVFNLDNKLEFFNFINIRQKYQTINNAKIALRKARLTNMHDRELIEKLIKKIEDLDDQTIYLQ